MSDEAKRFWVRSIDHPHGLKFVDVRGETVEPQFLCVYEVSEKVHRVLISKSLGLIDCPAGPPSPPATKSAQVVDLSATGPLTTKAFEPKE